MDAAIVLIPMLIMYVVGIYIGKHYDEYNKE